MHTAAKNLFRQFLLAIVWIPAAAMPTSAADEQVGTPETLGVGITETVDQIMKRDQTRSWPHRERVEEADLGLKRPVKPTDNPLAPFVSQWPPAEATLPPNEQLLGPQTVGTTFRAVTYPESVYLPPDSMGDVGPTQILVQVNGRIKVFGKTGVVGALNATQAAFWASVNGGLDQTDPQVRYDRLSGRWFATAINVATSNNRIMIAVSSGPTITGAASFTFYWFPLSAGGGAGDTANFCDYPSLGVDANALYIGCNMVNLSAGTFSRTTGYVVRKSSVTGGGPLVVTAFRNLANLSTAGPYAPRGVDNDDPAATQGFFIGADILNFGTLQIRRISDPGGTPTISGNLTIAVPATTFPISQPASGSAPNLVTIDDRLFMASIHKNKITGAITLRTVHHFEVNTSCVASPGGGRNGSRWYEIGNLTGTPSLVQAGTLCDSAASNPKGYIFPSVVGTGQGHMALAASVASSTQFVGIAASGRLRTDPLGSTQAPLTVLNGLAAYNDEFLDNRWGDFSHTDVDPADDQTVWTFQEYADSPASSNNWALRVVQLKAPPPATPSSAAPSTVCTGQPAVAIAITGTSSAGSEFFDPGPDTGGPGYANHIAASVTNGVLVSSTTFVDPTHATLTLDTTGAAVGPANVSVTNPDGQIASGANLITVAAAPGVVGDGVRLARSGLAAQISWNPPPGSTASDVVRGSVGALPAGPGGGDETCLVNDTAGSSFVDGTNPSAGQGFWYLIRGENACGPGGYGFQGVNGVPSNPRLTTTCL